MLIQAKKDKMYAPILFFRLDYCFLKQDLLTRNTFDGMDRRTSKDCLMSPSLIIPTNLHEP